MFQVDQGSHFKGMFEEFCAAYGKPLRKAGTEAHWEAGLTEVQGRVWEEVLR